MSMVANAAPTYLGPARGRRRPAQCPQRTLAEDERRQRRERLRDPRQVVAVLHAVAVVVQRRDLGKDEAVLLPLRNLHPVEA